MKKKILILIIIMCFVLVGCNNNSSENNSSLNAGNNNIKLDTNFQSTNENKKEINIQNVHKTENFESRTWDLKDNKTIKSPFINDEDMPWTITTSEEFSELMDTIDKMADSVALIDFADKEKKLNRKKL